MAYESQPHPRSIRSPGGSQETLSEDRHPEQSHPNGGTKASEGSSSHTLRKRPWRKRVTNFADILSAKYAGSGTQEDPYIVKWLDNDPENPKSYSMIMKCWITFIIAFMTLCVTLATSAYSGAAIEITKEFQCSEEVYLLGFSAMLVGFIFGPR